MKLFVFLLFTWISLCPVMAQKKVSQAIPYSAGKEIYLNLKFASDIVIKTWDKNEISFNADVNINSNANNDNFVVEVKPSDTQLEIKSVIKNLKEIAKEQSSASDGKSGNYYGGNGFWDDESHVYINSGARVSIDIDYEIYVPANASIRLKTISGNVISEYTKGKYTLETISGKIDLRLPATTRCNFGVKTISGDVYTDLSFELPKSNDDGLSRVGGKYESELRLNGGGEMVTLKTISGDIFLRKKK